MPISGKSEDLLLFPCLATISDALNPDEYFNFDLVKVGTLALHDALSSISLALSGTLLDFAMLIKVPVLEMLVASCHKEGAIRRESEGVHWLPKFVGGHTRLCLPFPDKEASIVRITQRDQV